MAPGNIRLGAVIQAAVDRRERVGDLDPYDLPIVVACRDLLANTIGQLPLVNYRGHLPTDVQPPIVVRPDPSEYRWQTFTRLVHQLTRAGYVWLFPLTYDASGWPTSVRVVDAAEAAGTFDPSGRLETVHWEGERYDPATDEVALLPYRQPRVGTLGEPPLAMCMRAVEYLAALWQMAGSYWEAGFPSIAYVVEAALSPTQRADTKAALIAASRRAHEPAVVDRGGRFDSLGGSAVESQLVESIEVANAEIARAFGVMPSLVNVRGGDSLTYSTTEGEMRKWLALGLGAYLGRIEAAWSDMRPYGQTARFDTGVLLRSDLAARYSAYSVALGRWLTVDEVRAAESLPPAGPGLEADAATPGTVPTLFADPQTNVPTSTGVFP